MNDSLAAEILEHIRHMDAKLTSHMDDEGKEIQSIRDDLVEWRIAAERRHTELIQSINAWTAKIDCTEAFITTPDGKVDLKGHKDDHLTRLQFDQWTAQVKRDVFTNTVKVGTLGLLTWILYVIWEAFLRGGR